VSSRPGASDQTRRVKVLNANWTPGEPVQFSVLIITEDDERHVVPASPATLIVANIVGRMPWTMPRADS
jgi:hypothetical protein